MSPLLRVRQKGRLRLLHLEPTTLFDGVGEGDTSSSYPVLRDLMTAQQLRQVRMELSPLSFLCCLYRFLLLC
jgi:hypothetical protein